MCSLNSFLTQREKRSIGRMTTAMRRSICFSRKLKGQYFQWRQPLQVYACPSLPISLSPSHQSYKSHLFHQFKQPHQSHHSHKFHQFHQSHLSHKFHQFNQYHQSHYSHQFHQFHRSHQSLQSYTNHCDFKAIPNNFVLNAI